VSLAGEQPVVFQKEKKVRCSVEKIKILFCFYCKFTKSVWGGGRHVTPFQCVFHQGQFVIFLRVTVNVINGLT